MSSRASAARAFTLLEVMIATMIIGMIALTLYRFLNTNLTAMRVSTEIADEREAVQAVIRLIAAQLNDLPLQEPEAIAGKPYKFRGLSNDELTWRSTAGAGLLTTGAAGDYRVTLTVQPVNERASETELGLRRQFIEPAEAMVSLLPPGGPAPGQAAALAPPPPPPTEQTRGKGKEEYHWLPLIRPMAAIEVRYFNGRLNAWQDTWNEPALRPTLVRVRLWKQAADQPVEAMLPVPSARLQQ